MRGSTVRRATTVVLGLLSVTALSTTLLACTGSDGETQRPGEVNSIDGTLADSITAAVENAMQLSGSTQAIVGVWAGESGEYIQAFGEGDINANTQFRGAQTTQPMVCAALLEYVEEGRLKLEREVAKDLTRQVGIDGVTYAQLCDMNSGIADYKGTYRDIFANNPERPWAERELIAQGIIDSPLSWPGLDFHQSDTNAIILERALRLKFGLDSEELLDSKVASPAGLRDTYYPDLSSIEVSGNALTPLTYPLSDGEPVCDVETTEVPGVSPSQLAGAGAAITTVGNLNTFYREYVDGQFGGETGAKLVREQSPTRNPERDKNGEPTAEIENNWRNWSFGLEVVGPLYGRTGAITGTISTVYYDPESGFSVVVVLNNSTAGDGFARHLAMQLAALASEAGVGPAELSWTSESRAENMAKGAVCQGGETAEEEAEGGE